MRIIGFRDVHTLLMLRLYETLIVIMPYANDTYYSLSYSMPCSPIVYVLYIHTALKDILY